MRNLIVIIATVLVVGVLAGYLSAQRGSIIVDDTDDVQRDNANSYFSDINWNDVLKLVPDYYTPPKVVEKKPKKKRVKRKPKPDNILDARLMGVVSGTASEALLLLPKQTEVSRYKVGESWLKGWILREIGSDHVVWEHTKNDERQVQQLFR